MKIFGVKKKDLEDFSPECRRWMAVQDAYEQDYDAYLNSPEFKRHEIWETVVRGFAVFGALVTALILVALLVPSASAQSLMVVPYEGRGYAGPVGSDLSGDPLVVQTVFAGRDAFGQAVEAVVPVEIDPINLDPAFNYAAFNPSIVDTAYLREFFASEGVTDMDGDGIFSQIAEITGIPSPTVNHTCIRTLASGGSSSMTQNTNPIVCLSAGTAIIDSWDGYDFSVVYTDTSSGTYPASASGDNCRVAVKLQVPTGGFTASNSIAVTWAGTFDVGINVTSDADCGTPSSSLSYEIYDGAPLIDLVPLTSRHAFVGDVLAVAAYNEDVIPAEWISTAADLTAQLEDVEGPCYEAADCIYPGAFDQAPLYWREGYSFVPGGALNAGSGGSGSGEGFACDETSTELACLDTGEVMSELPSELELEGFTVDPFEGEFFSDYLDEAAFEGYGETRECPAPFEFERSGIFGDGVVEMPVDVLCDVMVTYINPFLMLLAWFAAGIILFRS